MNRYIFALVFAIMFLTFRPVDAMGQPIQVIVDGKTLNTTTSPAFVNERLMVPMRAIFESMNANVVWYNGKIVATLGKTEIQLRPNDPKALINGRSQILATPSVVINGTTMVPLRFVGETLGASVDWLKNYNIVLITTSDFSSSKTDKYEKYAKFRNRILTYETTQDKYTAIKQNYTPFINVINTEIDKITPMVSAKDISLKVQANESLAKVNSLEAKQKEINSLGNSTVTLTPIANATSLLYSSIKNCLVQFAKNGAELGADSRWKSVLDQKQALEKLMSEMNYKIAEEKEEIMDYYKQNVQ